MISFRGFAFLAVGTLSLSSLSATQRDQARVSQVVRDVRLLSEKGIVRTAHLNDTVRDGSVVRTGTTSRAELTFADSSIIRVGASSVFTFDRAGRSVDVESGAILLRVPKGSKIEQIRSSALTADITGTTVMFEFRPRDYAKLIVLEGSSRTWLSQLPANKIELHAGQMLVVKASATRLAEPLEIDLDRLLRTAVLITEFPPLPSLGLIRRVADHQRTSGGTLINPLIDSTGMGARDVNASTHSQAKRSPDSQNRGP